MMFRIAPKIINLTCKKYSIASVKGNNKINFECMKNKKSHNLKKLHKFSVPPLNFNRFQNKFACWCFNCIGTVLDHENLKF